MKSIPDQFSPRNLRDIEITQISLGLYNPIKSIELTNANNSDQSIVAVFCLVVLKV